MQGRHHGGSRGVFAPINIGQGVHCIRPDIRLYFDRDVSDFKNAKKYEKLSLPMLKSSYFKEVGA